MNYINLNQFFCDNIDPPYQLFQKRLIPSKYPILGVRCPVIKTLAKQIVAAKSAVILDGQPLELTPFIHALLDKSNPSYEELLLLGFVIAFSTKNAFCENFATVQKYLTTIDNWSLCDSFCFALTIPECQKNITFDTLEKHLLNTIALFDKANDTNIFQIRASIVILLKFFTSEQYITKNLALLKTVDNFCLTLSQSQSYYIGMAIAWCIAECFAKNQTTTLRFLKQANLSKFVHNKAISKICDSTKIPSSSKSIAKTLRRQSYLC